MNKDSGGREGQGQGQEAGKRLHLFLVFSIKVGKIVQRGYEESVHPPPHESTLKVSYIYIACARLHHPHTNTLSLSLSVTTTFSDDITSAALC